VDDRRGRETEGLLRCRVSNAGCQHLSLRHRKNNTRVRERLRCYKTTASFGSPLFTKMIPDAHILQLKYLIISLPHDHLLITSPSVLQYQILISPPSSTYTPSQPASTSHLRSHAPITLCSRGAGSRWSTSQRSTHQREIIHRPGTTRPGRAWQAGREGHRLVASNQLRKSCPEVSKRSPDIN
jgi:hypothetical protein